MNTTIIYKIDGQEKANRSYEDGQLGSTSLIDEILDITMTPPNQARTFIATDSGEEKLLDISSDQTLQQAITELGATAGSYTIDVVRDKRTCGPKF